MRTPTSGARSAVRLGFSLCAMVASLSLTTATAQEFVAKPVAEKKVKHLPAGSLYWLVENFPKLGEAQAAQGPTSLAVEVAGKVWLFTLGSENQSTPGGKKEAEIGPLPPVCAPEYLLRINNASRPPGARTQVHTHPGCETFYVLTGQLSQKTAHGVSHVSAGQFITGHGPDTPMEVSSSGASDLNALVMFVVDATRPFSSPAKFE